MWPFKKKLDNRAWPPQITEEERATRLALYARRLTVRICNTGQWAAVGLGTIAWGVTADDAVQRHRSRRNALFPLDPCRPRPLRPRFVPVTGTGQWGASVETRYAEGPTPQIAFMRLQEKLNEGAMK